MNPVWYAGALEVPEWDAHAHGKMHSGSGAERRRQQLVTEKEREVTTRASSAYGCPLEMVTSFKYLGQVISVAYNSWPEVVNN